MFDYKHYVPILRWKQGEWLALRNLAEAERARMTPLVEITPRSVAPRRRQPTVDQMLQKNAADIRENWGPAPLFVDLCHLGPAIRTQSGVHPLRFLAEAARSSGVCLIPVTGLHMDSAYQSAVASVAEEDRGGASIRLIRNQLALADLRKDLERLLDRLGLVPSKIDLIVDCQLIDRTSPTLAQISASLPRLAEWRSFTVASGAFPPDLQGLQLGAQFLPRFDWRAWRSQLNVNPRLPRRPAFGDCTIQHAVYSEPPGRPNFSASIRYTTEDDWLIMRGEGVFHDGSPGFGQWPLNALLLRDRPEFCGANFSYGDQYIYQMSHQTQRTGSAETRLRAGFNHHLTYVVRQIASLFAP